MMSSSIALPVMQYLRAVNFHKPIFAYLGIDEENHIQSTGGSIELFGLENVLQGSLVLAHLDYLEGLLPGDETPVVIENTQFMSERYVDLHLFNKGDMQWVIFIDNTEAGKARQSEQQERLNSDILEEARKR